MKCFWIFNHNYSKWEITHYGKMRCIYTDRITRTYIKQMRTCEDCGKLQVKIVHTN